MSQNKKPIIGVSGSWIIDQGGMFPGYKRSYVNNDYIEAVIDAGGIPYIIPMNNNEEVIAAQLEMVDGLLMSGGHDANPLLWGEEPHAKLGGISAERDDFDMKLVKLAMEVKKPVLGICRGEQILNVANGGTLYQDLSLCEGSYIKHSQGHTPDLVTHSIEIKEGSLLESILGSKALVNSFHHLSVKDVAPGFKAVAFSKDGVIEAIEKEDGFALGLQWHPEMLVKKHENMLAIFKRFVEEAKK